MHEQTRQRLLELMSIRKLIQRRPWLFALSILAGMLAAILLYRL